MDDSQKAWTKARGVALASFPEDGASYGQLLERADAALYAAKRGGRNRLCLAGEPVVADPSAP